MGALTHDREVAPYLPLSAVLPDGPADASSAVLPGGPAEASAAVLLTAGTKGKRFALPHSRIMIHQPLISGGGISGQATEIEIEAKEISDTKKRLNEILAKHSGQSVEKVTRDSERNFYLSAEEAKSYGLIDEVISRKK